MSGFHRAPLLIACLIIAGAASGAERLVGAARVIDADTLDVGSESVRLWGVDAPERDQVCRRARQPWRCGDDAADALAELVDGQAVACETMYRDRYGRIVARCAVDGQDIGAWLVLEGWAVDWARYSGGAYQAEQVQARNARRGLWAGEFVMPWDWRRRR